MRPNLDNFTELGLYALAIIGLTALVLCGHTNYQPMLTTLYGMLLARGIRGITSPRPASDQAALAEHIQSRIDTALAQAGVTAPAIATPPSTPQGRTP